MMTINCACPAPAASCRSIYGSVLPWTYALAVLSFYFIRTFMHRFLLTFTALVWTSSAFSLTVPLSDVAARVQQRHPQLKAARQTIQEALGRQRGAGRLANPTLEVEYQNESRVSPQALVVSLDQSFPVTRRLSLEKQLSTQLVIAAELEVKDATRRYVAEARALSVRLLVLDKQRALRKQQSELAQELANFAQKRSSSGEISPLDSAQALVDAQRIQFESRRLEIEALTLAGALKPMLGLSPLDSLTLTGELPALVLPTSAPWEKRADYQLAQQKVQSAQTEAALAQAKRYGDVNAGLFTAREYQDVPSAGRERTGFVGIRVSIPLPFWNRNQGEIAEKAAAIERTHLEAEALAVQISHEARTAQAEMQANAELVAETRDKLLPLVQQQTETLQKAYESGQTDLLTLLRARDQRLQLEASVLNAQGDFHLARIRYEAAIGIGQ